MDTFEDTLKQTLKFMSACYSELVCNGWAGSKLMNAHISYKGRSVIIDYEHCLHDYHSIPEGTVPFEVYPYYGDIAVDYAKLNEKFNKKVDLEDLIEKLDILLENEN